MNVRTDVVIGLLLDEVVTMLPAHVEPAWSLRKSTQTLVNIHLFMRELKIPW